VYLLAKITHILQISSGAGTEGYQYPDLRKTIGEKNKNAI